MSLALHGVPKDITGVVAPVSLLLMVVSLVQQEATQAQMKADNLFGAKVQALIALIEDDRNKLASMPKHGARSERQEQQFRSIVSRHKRRVSELNDLLGRSLDVGRSNEVDPE